jgi:hypothetical protein
MIEDYRDKEQDRRIECLEGHIGALNSEMGNVQKAVEGIKTDVDWLKRSYWVIAIASIGAFVTAVVNFVTPSH